MIDIAEIISQRKLSKQGREIIRLLSEEISEGFIMKFRSDYIKRHNGMRVVQSQAQIWIQKLIEEAEKVCLAAFGNKYNHDTYKNVESKKSK